MLQPTLARTLLALLALTTTSLAFAQGALVEVAQTLVALAIVAVFVIVIWRRAPASLRWLGRLPGDVRIERERYTLHLPIVSALLVGLVLSAIVSLVGSVLGLVAVLFAWIGRLPGDFVFRRGAFTLFVPLASMLLLSLLLSAIALGASWLMRRQRAGRD